MGANEGLYDFGRALCLLSTVTGLCVPSHHFMAVYSPKNEAQICQFITNNHYAYLTCIIHSDCVFL